MYTMMQSANNGHPPAHAAHLVPGAVAHGQAPHPGAAAAAGHHHPPPHAATHPHLDPLVATGHQAYDFDAHSRLEGVSGSAPDGERIGSEVEHVTQQSPGSYLAYFWYDDRLTRLTVSTSSDGTQAKFVLQCSTKAAENENHWMTPSNA